MTDDNIWPRPYRGFVPMRITSPSGHKDVMLDAYVVEDGGDGYPAIGLSGNVGKGGNTWYRPLLTYNQLQSMLTKLETEIDRQRAEHNAKW